MKYQFKTLAVLTAFGLFSLLLMAMSSLDSGPADVRIPIRPTPRPTETPESSQPPQMTGGFIVLQAGANASDTSGLWTRVEWQDPHTQAWNQVEGWQGEFDGDKRVTWFVARQNLNEQLFRWVVYSDEGQTKRVAVSDPFDLPTTARQTVIVDISW